MTKMQTKSLTLSRAYFKEAFGRSDGIEKRNTMRPNEKDHWKVMSLIRQCWKAILDQKYEDAYRFWDRANVTFRNIRLPDKPTGNEYHQYNNMSLLICGTKDTLGIYGEMRERERKETLSRMAGLAMALMVDNKADDVEWYDENGKRDTSRSPRNKGAEEPIPEDEMARKLLSPDVLL